MLKHIKTMAVRITKETYPLAIACLPGNFATTQFEEVKGCYLIINEVGAHWCGENGGDAITEIRNVYETEGGFHSRWKFVGKEKSGRLVEIKRRKSPTVRVGYPGGRVVSSYRSGR